MSTINPDLLHLDTRQEILAPSVLLLLRKNLSALDIWKIPIQNPGWKGILECCLALANRGRKPCSLLTHA